METFNLKKIRSVLKRLNNFKKICEKNNLSFHKEKIKPKNRSKKYTYNIFFGNKHVTGFGKDSLSALKSALNKIPVDFIKESRKIQNSKKIREGRHLKENLKLSNNRNLTKITIDQLFDEARYSI